MSDLCTRPLVVIPTYNEADNIAEVLRRARICAPTASFLVVDDGSPDGTADVVRVLADELGAIELMERTEKAGLGSAYRAGFRWGLDAGHDVVVEMDADLSHDPAMLPELFEAIDAGADLAIGSRYVPGGSIPSNWAWHRKALSRWGNRYVDAMLRIGVRDATAGYRAYRASMLASIDLDGVRADGYGFQVEMAYRVRAIGGTISEIPIDFTDRTKGSSKMSARIVVEAMALVTAWGIRDRLRR